jgi:hypothetical protein
MSVSEDKTRVMVSMLKTLRDELQKEADVQNRSLSNYILTIIMQRQKPK